MELEPAPREALLHCLIATSPLPSSNKRVHVGTYSLPVPFAKPAFLHPLCRFSLLEKHHHQTPNELEKDSRVRNFVLQISVTLI